MWHNYKMHDFCTILSDGMAEGNRADCDFEKITEENGTSLPLTGPARFVEKNAHSFINCSWFYSHQQDTMGRARLTVITFLTVCASHTKLFRCVLASL